MAKTGVTGVVDSCMRVLAGCGKGRWAAKLG